MFTPLLSSGIRRVCALALAASLAACGGGGNDDTVTDGGGTPPVRPADPEGAGQLQAATLLGTVAAADIAAALTSEESLAQDVVPRYAVTSYRLEYLTTDADGKAVRASGLVSVPQKAPGAKSPVLSYQHGTLFRDAEAPSNNAVASEVAVVLASLGYIVLAPDYVGFGASKGTPHPYLLAAPSAAATVDFLTAARTWRGQANVADNGQLFLTGYSEGGYVTMAAHRALQTSGSSHLQQLRMVVPGAGPYNVQATMDSLVDLVRDEQPVIGALINPGFLRYLGGSVQREVRRLLLRALMPGDADVVYDARFIDRFLDDDVPYIAEFSSVHDWKPNLPVRLYHGQDDRTVPYASSASTLQAMQQRGAGDLVSLTDCRAQPAGHMQCVPPFITFMLGQLAPVAQDL
ncbi:MAG TPA: prolyl oligopeptidase family serine peptidase [Giesbergeria sp.]|nr:lipase family protein [Giesbergeria sp.]HMZ86030.1 prolyl oligopeptidase family serine peptidase [Giesbergeria sp.]HNN16294.1 prolyl oligopeptidase family serine peptidase [Giesbergeria sp.]HNN88472.1 prolyl oligopeptidase family serine peptidase [Giesbergeria sp.]HQY77914.1 prolyl oligopeptidase family serine peptidase [Rhodoferax sp.]